MNIFPAWSKLLQTNIKCCQNPALDLNILSKNALQQDMSKMRKQEGLGIFLTRVRQHYFPQPLPCANHWLGLGISISMMLWWLASKLMKA